MGSAKHGDIRSAKHGDMRRAEYWSMGRAEHGTMKPTAMNHTSLRRFDRVHTHPGFARTKQSRPRCAFSHPTHPRKRASLDRVLLHRRGEKVPEGGMRGGYASLPQTAFPTRNQHPARANVDPRSTRHSPTRACERKRHAPLPQSCGIHRPRHSAGECHLVERQPGVGTCRANPRLW